MSNTLEQNKFMIDEHSFHNSKWIVLDFGGQFCPIFGKGDKKYFSPPLDHYLKKKFN